MFRKLVQSALSLTLLAILIAGVALPSASAQDGSRIVMAISGEPPNLDPHINAGTPARTVRLVVYRGLFNYDKEGVASPELAESYTISEDGLTYTFVLRDAQFHNGDPVTAEDVKYSFERILNPETGATFFTQMSVIDGVTAIDEKTVEVKLSKVTAPFIDYLALPESAIVSKSWAEEHDGDLSGNPMGAGPYMFKEYVEGQRIVVEKFDNFYKEGLPVTDEIVFEFYPDETTRVNALLSGDVDLISYVPWKDIPMLQADDNLQILGGTGPFMGLIFNTNFEPFADARVREAVAYAIDRYAVINTALSGQGQPIYGMAVPQNSIAYDPQFDSYFEYDPDKAKELLAEAGYADGFSARLLSTSQYGMHEQTAVAVQAELAKIGIDLELDLPDWATRIEQNLAGDYDLLVVGTAGDVADPDYLSDYYQSGDIRLNNAPGYANARVDELLELGRTTIDPEERKAIYGELQEIVLEDSPLVFLAWRDQSYAAVKDLQGFANLPGFLSFQSGITLEEAYLAG
ncbi:ABC transporter substrate-binding protein [Aggregatilinea lenta]|uniref:ABC transporter substrate-binding protein n=1 Tax=Aggregatilinea lenta TaxID=913108 RepID=UPI000E5B5A9F|nr:ABC transporter substrate-binding protein [Aggregatilinea lenta]